MLLHFRLNNSLPSRTHGPLEQKLIPGSRYMTELPQNSPLTVISCQPVNGVLCWPHRIIFSVVPTPATLPKSVYWCLLFSFEWICSCYMWARCQMECEEALSNSGKVCWSDLPDYMLVGQKKNETLEFQRTELCRGLGPFSGHGAGVGGFTRLWI